MSKTTYMGDRSPDGCKVFACRDGQLYALDAHLEVWNHSPTGFEWGYGGSGPAQLALALLLDATGDQDLAIELHQTFKWEVVSKFQKPHWELERGRILAWAYAHSQEGEDAFLERTAGPDAQADNDLARVTLGAGRVAAAQGADKGPALNHAPELDW